jgi:hypothetical protein
MSWGCPGYGVVGALASGWACTGCGVVGREDSSGWACTGDGDDLEYHQS